MLTAHLGGWGGGSELFRCILWVLPRLWLVISSEKEPFSQQGFFSGGGQRKQLLLVHCLIHEGKFILLVLENSPCGLPW